MTAAARWRRARRWRRPAARRGSRGNAPSGPGSRGRRRGARGPGGRGPLPGGRRAACRRCSRSPAAAASIRGPSRPRRGRGNPGPAARTASVTRGQNAGAAIPHVRSKTSGSTSIAMSQRTPSHWPRNPRELAEHRLLEGGVAVVQLKRVRPAVEVRVAPVRQDARAIARLHATVVLGRRGELLLRARHEEVRVLGDPGVVRRHVVRDEVEHEAQAAALQTLAEPGERLVAAEVLVDAVVADREARAADVVLTEVGQDAAVLGEPLGFERETRRAASPVCQTPRNQTRSNPSAASRSSSTSGMSSSVAARPSAAASSESRTRVLTWNSAGYRLMCVPSALRRHLLPDQPVLQLLAFGPPASSGSRRANRSSSGAARPVQPVWWLAPSPAPLSPWKYS